ncbi:acyl-CoA N-acyltransferase [Obelidium mucronatum]|nr:acyl-CoA N-acyltransferase [Obelidium mucronatum]
MSHVPPQRRKQTSAETDDNPRNLNKPLPSDRKSTETESSITPNGTKKGPHLQRSTPNPKEAWHQQKSNSSNIRNDVAPSSSTPNWAAIVNKTNNSNTTTHPKSTDRKQPQRSQERINPESEDPITALADQFSNALVVADSEFDLPELDSPTFECVNIPEPFATTKQILSLLPNDETRSVCRLKWTTSEDFSDKSVILKFPTLATAKEAYTCLHRRGVFKVKPCDGLTAAVGGASPSPSKRPIQTDAVARRLIAGALGVKLAKKTPEQLDLEQRKKEQVLAEREEKRKAEQEALKPKAPLVWADEVWEEDAPRSATAQTGIQKKGETAVGRKEEPPRYIHRHLTDAEIPRFLTHLEAVFHVVNPATGAMGAPRGFFAHHWEEDFAWSRNAAACFVSESNGQIAASTRAYSRRLNVGGFYEAVVGVGDVATRIEHRGRGLAKTLLGKVDDFCKRNEYAMAVLHASAMGFPVYEKAGWRNIVMQTASIMTTRKQVLLATTERKSDNCVLPIDFKKPEHLAVLKACHSLLSVNIGGSFSREDDDHYWKGYVGDCRDDRRFAARLMFTPNGKTVSDLEIGDCVGYIICDLFKRDLENAAPSSITPAINIQIRDLFLGKVSTFKDHEGGLRVVDSVAAQTVSEFTFTLSSLIESAIKNLLQQWIKNADALDSRQIQFNFPAALLPNSLFEATGASWLAKEARKQGEDVGTMYKIFKPFAAKSIATGVSIQVKNVEDLRNVFQAVQLGRPVPFAACEGVYLEPGSPLFGFFKSDAF